MTENCKQSGNSLNELVQIRTGQGRHKNSALIFSNCRISVESWLPSTPGIFWFFLLSQKMLRNALRGRNRQGSGSKYEVWAVCICTVGPHGVLWMVELLVLLRVPGDIKASGSCTLSPGRNRGWWCHALPCHSHPGWRAGELQQPRP